jgi:putative transcriptional regulator
MVERVLHNRVKATRLEQGLTQAELAEKIQVSRKTVNTIENEVFVPSTTVALLMASALGKTVEELFYLGDT